ncbi:MAG TPA: pyridoxamine 5'-phosphate oxidase family protein [Pseudonocardiaceae bacterium]
MSGAGKTTLAHALQRRGVAAIDTDADATLAYFIDTAGAVVDRPPAPDFAWLATHRWVWSPTRLVGLLEHHRNDTLFLCGHADNDTDFLERYAGVFLLCLDEITMLRRLADPQRGNDFGAVGDTGEQVRPSDRRSATGHLRLAGRIRSVQPEITGAERLLDEASADGRRISERLATEPAVWLGTVRPDRRLHHVPVAFAWSDPLVLIFSMANTVKLRNIEHNPAVSLSLNAAQGGNDVVIEDGQASCLAATAPEVVSLTPTFERKYAALLAETTFDEWRSTFSQPVLVTVTRIVAWTIDEIGVPHRVISDRPHKAIGDRGR